MKSLLGSLQEPVVTGLWMRQRCSWSNMEKWLESDQFRYYIGKGVDSSLQIDWFQLVDNLNRGSIQGEKPDIGVLEIAASLATDDYLVNLSNALPNQKPEVMDQIVNAVRHAGGYVDWTSGEGGGQVS